MSEDTEQTSISSTDGRTFLVVVDDSPEMLVAIRFACRHAHRTGDRVALLRVVEPAHFQHWATVGDLMREEAREEAEQLLQKLAAEIQDLTNQTPVLYVREGNRTQALLSLIREEPSISILVLAAARGGDPGPIINFLSKKNFGKLRVPVTIVPGNLTVRDIDALS